MRSRKQILLAASLLFLSLCPILYTIGIILGEKTDSLFSYAEISEISGQKRTSNFTGMNEFDSESSLQAENDSSESSTETYFVSKNSSVYKTLIKAGIPTLDIYRIVEAAEYEENLAAVSPQTAIEVIRDPKQESVLQIKFIFSQLRSLIVSKSEDEEWKAELIEKSLRIEKVAFQGKIETNLWETLSKVGLSAEVIYKLTNIFGWQVDFERELVPGASWSLLIEKTFVDQEQYGWGNILAAEINNMANRHVAIRFPQTGPDAQYYDLQGKGLKGAFLKSPLRYSRISSPFQKIRFHPILKINRPHKGVDYAAAYGTPVHAVGDATAHFVGYNGGSGKVVELKHGKVYSTAYKHLSSFSKNLKRGDRIRQGQVIGYVGATGLATGPHLHFEFYENGQYIDPLGKTFPRQLAIADEYAAAFKKVARTVYLELPKDIRDRMRLAAP